MDIAGLVRNIVAAFDDAVNLVRRISDRKDVKDDPVALADLISSLSLGPVVIRGYYDSDFKRFGEAYTLGDMVAREELKDVLISLQMTILTTLRTVLLDNEELDYNTLLETSDNCRVNAGVCLGQLSQRLAEHMRLYSQNPPAYAIGGAYLGGLHYSSSQSTHSSSGTRRKPDPNLAQFAKLNLNAQPHLNAPRIGMPLDPQRSPPQSHDSYSSWTSDNQNSFFYERDHEALSMRRPSSQALAPEDGALLSPVASPVGQRGSENAGDSTLPGAQNLARESYMTLGGLPTDSGSTRDSSNSNNSNSNGNSNSNNNANSKGPISVNTEVRDRFGPDDYSPIVGPNSNQGTRAFGSLYERNPPVVDTRQSVTSYAHRAHGIIPVQMPSFSAVPQYQQQPLQDRDQSMLNAYQYYPGHPPQQPAMGFPPRAESYMSPTIPARKPVTVPYPHSQQQGIYTDMPRPPVSGQIPGQTENRSLQAANIAAQQSNRPRTDSNSTRSNPRSPPPVMSTPTTPRQQQASPATDMNILRSPTNTITTYTSNTSAPRSVPAPPPTGPLNLPTEKNTLGLCKGAFRLFVGVEKKAFSAANRPAGYSGMIQYWRCEKCSFEGPMAYNTLLQPGAKKAKPEKCFDSTVREMYGIRYKWAFLAKCHVALKSIPPDGPSRKEGSFGSYGCLFCAAEGQLRNWPVPTTNASSDAASTRSGSSAGGGMGNNGAPIFGNLTSFMEHLHKHRSEEWWPNTEMQNRMKCVVGRVAERGENFEINLMPLSATNGA